MSRRRSRVSSSRPSGIAEEPDVGHADRGRGGPLLGLAQRAHLVARGVVEAAGVAVGDDAVGDLGAGRGPGGDGPGAAEVDVVGVGERRTARARRARRAAAGGGVVTRRSLEALEGDGEPGQLVGVGDVRAPARPARRPATSCRAMNGPSSVHATTAGAPLTSATSTRRPGRSRALRPDGGQEPGHLVGADDRPPGRRHLAAAVARSGRRRAPARRAGVSTSPPTAAARNRSVTSRCARRSVSNRGCRACTCSRARCAICRTAASRAVQRRGDLRRPTSRTPRAARRPRARPGTASRAPRAAPATPARRARRRPPARRPAGPLATGARPVSSGSGSHGPT